MSLTWNTIPSVLETFQHTLLSCTFQFNLASMYMTRNLLLSTCFVTSPFICKFSPFVLKLAPQSYSLDVRWTRSIIGKCMWHNESTQFPITVYIIIIKRYVSSGQYNTALLVLKISVLRGTYRIAKICHQMRAEATKWLPSFTISRGNSPQTRP